VSRKRAEPDTTTIEYCEDLADSIQLASRLIRTIADRIENDGADPCLAVGENPDALWALGDALMLCGRVTAAEIAYRESIDRGGDE
jgi:hypothetical protein